MTKTRNWTPRRRAACALGTVALVGGSVAAIIARKRAAETPPHCVGVAANGMRYEVFGDGARTVLFIPGGPGSEISTGLMGKLRSMMFAPYVDAGYTVWNVIRRRHMPVGHTVAEMADDYAQFVRDELGGHVDLVIGESYGGMIAQYLAANHPSLTDRVVLAVAAGTITGWGVEVDLDMARAQAEGRYDDAGAAFLEYITPGDEMANLRRRLGPLVGRFLAHPETPPGDLIVEAEAEVTFDARPELGRITAPVLMLCGDQDRFFSPDDVAETAGLIPNCTLIWYEGMGHMRAASSGQIPRDVLAWTEQLDAAAV